MAEWVSERSEAPRGLPPLPSSAFLSPRPHTTVCKVEIKTMVHLILVDNNMSYKRTLTFLVREMPHYFVDS